MDVLEEQRNKKPIFDILAVAEPYTTLQILIKYCGDISEPSRNVILVGCVIGEPARSRVPPHGSSVEAGNVKVTGVGSLTYSVKEQMS